MAFQPLSLIAEAIQTSPVGYQKADDIWLSNNGSLTACSPAYTHELSFRVCRQPAVLRDRVTEHGYEKGEAEFLGFWDQLGAQVQTRNNLFIDQVLPLKADNTQALSRRKHGYEPSGYSLGPSSILPAALLQKLDSMSSMQSANLTVSLMVARLCTDLRHAGMLDTRVRLSTEGRPRLSDISEVTEPSSPEPISTPTTLRRLSTWSPVKLISDSIKWGLLEGLPYVEGQDSAPLSSNAGETGSKMSAVFTSSTVQQLRNSNLRSFRVDFSAEAFQISGSGVPQQVSPNEYSVDTKQNLDIFSQRSLSVVQTLADVSAEVSTGSVDANVVVEKKDGRLFVRFKMPAEFASYFAQASVSAVSMDAAEDVPAEEDVQHSPPSPSPVPKTQKQSVARPLANVSEGESNAVGWAAAPSEPCTPFATPHIPMGSEERDIDTPGSDASFVSTNTDVLVAGLPDTPTAIVLGGHEPLGTFGSMLADDDEPTGVIQDCGSPVPSSPASVVHKTPQTPRILRPRPEFTPRLNRTVPPSPSPLRQVQNADELDWNEVSFMSTNTDYLVHGLPDTPTGIVLNSEANTPRYSNRLASIASTVLSTPPAQYTLFSTGTAPPTGVETPQRLQTPVATSPNGEEATMNIHIPAIEDGTLNIHSYADGSSQTDQSFGDLSLLSTNTERLVGDLPDTPTALVLDPNEFNTPRYNMILQARPSSLSFSPPLDLETSPILQSNSDTPSMPQQSPVRAEFVANDDAATPHQRVTCDESEGQQTSPTPSKPARSAPTLATAPTSVVDSPGEVAAVTETARPSTPSPTTPQKMTPHPPPASASGSIVRDLETSATPTVRQFTPVPRTPAKQCENMPVNLMSSSKATTTPHKSPKVSGLVGTPVTKGSPLKQSTLSEPRARTPQSARPARPDHLAEAQEAEDRAYLDKFLNQHKASKAARTAEIQSRPSTMSTGSPAPRLPLGQVDVNISSPKKTSRKRKTEDGEVKVVDPSEPPSKKTRSSDNAKASDLRRSTRVRAKKAEDVADQADQGSKIPVRVGSGVIGGQATGGRDADLAAVTRTNTRRNKGQADMPEEVLARQRADPQGHRMQELKEIHDARVARQGRPAKKKAVAWGENQIVYHEVEDEEEEMTTTAPEPVSMPAPLQHQLHFQIDEQVYHQDVHQGEHNQCCLETLCTHLDASGWRKEGNAQEDDDEEYRDELGLDLHTQSETDTVIHQVEQVKDLRRFNWQGPRFKEHLILSDHL
ncbi:unnamed protein product [Parascedosporium putredinis]|uniref:Uncharacterized protein n=1 Tax=Parascedosporium putredinis TaxID=1442378 RepID=A0A9P1H9Y6_9PEZI|nr:unnamed protein product [Parascedosporium putredinis]CAI8004061.1 unnamed protein product [Parascedosporium putredinis]